MTDKKITDGLNERARDVARRAFREAFYSRESDPDTATDAAISAYLKAAGLNEAIEGDVRELVKALHRLMGELPPETRGWWTAEQAADTLLSQQREIESVRIILASTDIGSLPHDYPTAKMALDRMAHIKELTLDGLAWIGRYEAQQREIERLRERLAQEMEYPVGPAPKPPSSPS